MSDPDIRYFIYSKEQLKERTRVEALLGKKFHVGSLIIHGKSNAFTQIVKNIDSVRYPDYKVIAHVDINTAKYTAPYAE